MLKTELDVLKFWDENSIFQKSLDQNRANKPFTFIDGPPFANGTPHWGHIFISQVKDTVLRYQTQKGFYVPRRWGWDCHGVPVESQIEKKFGIKDKREIENDIGLDQFNNACRSSIMTNDALWRQTIHRIGRWVDMDNQYRTMDNEFSESVWWGLGQLWDQGLLYKGHRISLYSPSLGIPLSHTDVAMEVKYVNETMETPVVKFSVLQKDWKKINSSIFEAIQKQIVEQNQTLKQLEKDLQNLQRKETVKKIGYTFTVVEEDSLPAEIIENLEINEAKEKLQIVKENIKTLQKIANVLKQEGKLNIVAWTTTPWTLPSNTCLAINPDINYSIFYLPASEEFILIAENRAISVISQYLGHNAKNTSGVAEKLENLEDSSEFLELLNLDITKIATIQGKDLEGMEYEPIFKLTQKIKDYDKKAGLFKIYTADFVSDEDGTGIVHIAPYGEDDFKLINERNLPIILTLNEHGEIRDDLDEDLAPVFNKKYEGANPLIIKILEKNEKVFYTFKHTHRVPLFDRDGKKVYYAPQEGWFIAETKLKEKSLELNELVNWHPESLKHGRFGKGLETAPDWSISRNRYWGNPLPIWQNKKGDKHIFINSFEKLVEYAVNPFYRLLNSRDLNPELYSKYKTVIFGDSQSKLPLGINASQYRSKNLYELRQQKEYDMEKFSHFAQKILEEILELFEKYNIVQLMFSDEERRMWTTWLYDLHKDSKKIAPVFYFYKKVKFDFDQWGAYGKLIPFDVHRPVIDDIILKDEVNEYYTRIPEVLDCWVESGSMPWASWHYPFENKEIVEKNVPADWIIEAQDQTRGWFRVLHILSGGIFDKQAFKNVSCSGLILASDGTKMSKSKKNFADPNDTINQYGSDAVRLYLSSSALLNAESVSFKDRDLKTVFQSSTLLISNIIKYVQYVQELVLNENHVLPEISHKYRHPLNKWWYAYTLEEMIKFQNAMDNYKVMDAARIIIPFLDNLSTWYIRRSKDTNENWLLENYTCMYTTLKLMATVFASLQPFNMEKVWSVIRKEKDPESVHLTSLPKLELLPDSKAVISEMNSLRELIYNIHKFRKENDYRVRQPLYADFKKLNLDKHFVELIVAECNLIEKDLSNIEGELWVNESEFGKIIIDSVVDEELKNLGLARDFERSIQEFRKKRGFKQQDFIKIEILEMELSANINFEKIMEIVDWQKLNLNMQVVDKSLSTVDNFKVEVKNLGIFHVQVVDKSVDKYL